MSPYIQSGKGEAMRGPTEGWEEQRLVLGVGEYRARHRRLKTEGVSPRFPPDVPPPLGAAHSLRFQVERVLLLFDEVDRPTLLAVERVAGALRQA